MIETRTPPLPMRLGQAVRCRDGLVGRLADVVLHPEEGRVTHVVVEGPGGDARLVPASLLAPRRSQRSAVGLSCTKDAVAACASIRSFAYVGLDERASRVVSVDGEELGSVDGFLVADGRTTHVLLHGVRPPAIPIDSVETIETDRITVRLSKHTADALRGIRSPWLPFG